MRNARQSEAASRSASVFEHEVDVCGHGGNIPRRYLGGPGDEYRLSEVPFGEYAMRGSKRPHPALLMSPSTNWTYAVTVDIFFVGISDGSGMNIVYRRSHLAKTQCEAVKGGRIPPC